MTKEARKLEEVMKTHNFRQLIETPTRSDVNSESLIDHVWASPDCGILECGTVEGISYHAGIYVTFNKPEPIPKVKPKHGRTYKNFCPDQTSQDFLQNLSKSSFDDEIQKEDIVSSYHLGKIVH